MLLFPGNSAASSSQLGMSFLDDGVVRVGVNLDDGKITAAIVGDDGFGVGIVEPMTTTIVAIPGTVEATEYPWSVNGYLAPAEPEIIDANAVYSYSYSLVVGSLEGIRAYAVRTESMAGRTITSATTAVIGGTSTQRIAASRSTAPCG
jgi:hypothetical protein